MNNTTKNFKSSKDFIKGSYQVQSVPTGTRYWVRFLLSRCQNLFIYENLPDTLPAWEIEKNLIIKGNGAVIKKKNDLYIPFEGNIYGWGYAEEDKYKNGYLIPNKFTFANPVIGSGSGLTDGKDCAIIWNSDIDKNNWSCSSWLWETIQRYARMLAECESSLVNNMVYSRAGLVGQAKNGAAAKGYDEMIRQLKLGETSTITNAAMDFGNLDLLPVSPLQSFSGYFEARDCLLNSFYNTIGLQTLEEKKERMVVDEIDSDSDILENNIDIMYKARIENVNHINDIFGTDIKVYKNAITGKPSNNELEEDEEIEQPETEPKLEERADENVTE